MTVEESGSAKFITEGGGDAVANGLDGMGVAAALYNDQTWWTTEGTWATSGGATAWKFGTDEANPWKWDSGKGLPVLWFE